MNTRGVARRTRHQSGQILVVMVVGLVAMFAMVGLVVDGGFAFAQQRATQNGTDAAADAGAVTLAGGVGGTMPLDSAVLAAVNGAVANNGLASAIAYYTDVKGQLLTAAGTPTTVPALAVQVGQAPLGTVPPCLDAASCVNGYASGVQVAGRKTTETFVARVIGIDSFGIGATATAVSGYLTGNCDAQAGCNVLPVTFPVTIVTCDGQNNPVPAVPPVPYVVGSHYSIPLCKNGPGNVGWLDWSPPAGGTLELVNAILNPTNPAIPVPSWQSITATGNINAKTVEDAINTYAGKVVLIPQFDATCDTQPSGSAVGNCPPADVGGHGTNQWYHLPQFAALLLDSPKAAYITGANPQCDTGNGATSCIKGKFVRFITGGVVGPGAGTGSNTSVVGVQLIK